VERSGKDDRCHERATQKLVYPPHFVSFFPERSGTADAVLVGVQGTITSKDVLLHSVTILRLWGPAFYVRCIRAIASGRSCTFLEILASKQ
jgi:hypothetical protein